LASRANAPDEDLAIALQPYLVPTQEAVKAIRDMRVDRDYDRHQKAVIELCGVFSWVFFKAPDQLPVPAVNEVLGSAEFWSNRIRKEFKGKDEKQIEFCDTLKKVVTGLAEYLEAWHNSGLTFNPKGLSFKETAIRMSDDPEEMVASKTPKPKHPMIGVTTAPNVAGLIGELSKRKTGDGSSAATGLKHVSCCIPAHCIVDV
jgi:adenylyl cyclase-associated protein